ncbi:hypothetical protein D5086_023934 [Populus alba]|uniref:Uncharacterized protein n=2 Tax=Populus alba TaxID=43335 RepID=A0ACC4B4S9_POPAL|nr:hypothetical protein D5086_0000143670 [Populus alba]
MAELLPIYFSVIAFFCALGAMALAIFHIYRHLLNYTEPTYQRYIVRIIFMVPIESAGHLRSVNTKIFWERMVGCQILPGDGGWYGSVIIMVDGLVPLGINPRVLLRPTSGLSWVRSTYLAVVSFDKLLSCAKFKWSGYEAIMVSDDLLLSSHAAGWVSFSSSMAFGMLKSHFLFAVLFEGASRVVCQFVILKCPSLVAVTLILYAKGKYMDGNFSPKQSYLYLTIIYTISYTLALYALALFYVACKDLLQPFNPVPKFIIIKSVVFLTYWQGVLFFLAAKSGFIKDAEEAAQFQFAPTYHDYVLYNHTEGDDGTRKYRSRTFVPTGQEMDAVRKNKLMFGNKMDELSSHSSSATSTPKNDSSVPHPAHSDAMKSSHLMGASDSLSSP